MKVPPRPAECRYRGSKGFPLFLKAALICFQAGILAFLPVRTTGHSMGEAVPIAFAGEGDERFAAIVIAEYFGQQMGREVSLVPGGSNEECLDMLRSGMAPMAVLDGRPDGSILKGGVVIDPVLVVNGQVRVLVMGEAAVRQLQFSLVPMYMEKLKSVLTIADWENGLARVRSGEGIRKAAIDMLRGKDLI